MKQNFSNQKLIKIFFGLVIVFIFAFLVNQVRVTFNLGLGQSNLSKSENLQELSSSLLQQAKTYTLASAEIKSKSLNDLLAIIEKRRQAMIELASSNPAEFLSNAFPSKILNQLPQEIQSQLEQQVEVRGKIAVFHTDDFSSKRSKNQYILESISPIPGKKYNLQFAKIPSRFQPGSTVTIKGTTLDTQLVFSGSEESIQTVSGPASLTFGEQKTIIILINFTDNSTEPFTLEDINSLVFDATVSPPLGVGSVDSFYRETSYNQTYLSGNVVGWYQIPLSSQTCDMDGYSNAADAAAARAGANLTLYSHKVYVFPYANCPFGGAATLGTVPTRAWINGVNSLYIFAHELGHNFDVNHASSLSCGTKQIDVYSNCTMAEYGDPTDVMGSQVFQFNGPHKIVTNWVPLNRVQTVTAPGVYEVFGLEKQYPDIQVLKIKKSDTNEDYYLSFRQPLGFDAYLPQGFTEGVSIHIWPGQNQNNFFQTKLIDTTSQDFDFTNAALSDGASFEDKINGIRVTQIAHTASFAAVQIDYFPVTCYRANPTVGIFPPSQSGIAGEATVYRLSIQNNDINCDSTTFNLTSLIPSGWQTEFSPSKVTLEPSMIATPVMSLTSSNDAVDGVYSFSVTVSDILDLNHAGAVESKYMIYTPIDTIPPQVYILKPADNSKLSRFQPIEISATDNVGVVKVEIYADNVLLATLKSPPYIYTWDTRRVKKGSHTITVKAYDTAGNMGGAKITVFK